MNVSERITKLREERGVSKNKLASMAGMAQSYLSEIESGKKNPTVDMLDRICKALGLTLLQFFDDDANPLYAPPDISEFAIDQENHELIRVVSGMKEMGLASVTISEWLQIYCRSLIEYGLKHGISADIAVWPKSSPGQLDKLKNNMRNSAGLRHKIDAFRHKK